MKNKAYYFSHDGNAHNDVKIQYLIADLGMEGYGIFWFLIESLFESGGVLPMKIIKILARQMNSSEAKVKTVIEAYDLFQVCEQGFYSERLMKHFEIRKSLSDSGKEGAEKRWGGNRGAIDTPIARKEKKGKEKKINEIQIVGKRYLAEDFGELPENYIQSCKEQIKIQKNFDLGVDEILKMWSVFKLQKLVGEEFFASESKVYQYFINWIKNQKFENGTNQKLNGSKKRNAGAYELLEELRAEHRSDS